MLTFGKEEKRYKIGMMGAISAVFADVVHTVQDPIIISGSNAGFTLSGTSRTHAAINLILPKATNVLLKVYNVNGKEISTLINSGMKAGYHSIEWSGKDAMGKPLAGGIYLFQLITENAIQTERFIMVK